jgi:cell division protein FtsB
MEPLNQHARTAAFVKFIGLYLLIVTIPLVASYLFFYAPNQAVEQENARLKSILAEQHQLMAQLSTMGTESKELEQIDKSLSTQSDEMTRAEAMKRVDESEGTLKSVIRDVKRDSAALTSTQTKRMSKDLINTFEALFTYRNTIALLREYNQKNGVDTETIEKLTNALKVSENKLENLQLILAATAKGGGGGGGGDESKAREIDRLTKEVNAYKTKVESLQRQLASQPGPAVASSDNKSDGKSQELIEDLRVSLDFAQADCDRLRADELKNTSQRRKLYNQALQSFNNIYQNSRKETSKKEAKLKVDEINQKLKKLGASDF